MPDFVIKLRRSGTTGSAPDVSDLQLGELAVNTYDGKLFLKKDNGTPSVIEVGLGCDLAWTPSTRTISSSSGNNAVITNVTTSNSGLMSSTDKSKLDGIAAGAEVNIGTDLSYVANSREIQSSTGGNATLPEVIASSTSGLMTGSDKNKLDGIATGAETNVGTDLTYTSATRSLSSSTGTDVTLPLVGAGGSAGLMSGTDKTKLDSIQSNAQINVQADFNATSGDAKILNKPSIPANLGDLNNVDSTAATNGQVLTWDNANSYWEAADAPAYTTNADTVDNLHASSFLRSDQSDTMMGNLTVSGRVSAGSNLDVYTSSGYWLRSGTSSSTNVIGFTNGNLMLGGTLDPTFAATQQPNISLNATNGDATFAGSIECILNSTYKTTIGNNGSIALYGTGGLVTYLENDGTSTFGNTFKVKIRPFNSANADQFQVLNSSGTVTASITGGGSATFKGTLTSSLSSAGYAYQLNNGSTNLGGLYRDTGSSRLILGDGSTTKIDLQGSNGSASFGGAIGTSGQNTVNEASTLKFSQESANLSQIRAYGSNTSTSGSLEFKVGPSTGAPFTPLTLNSNGTSTFSGNVTVNRLFLGGSSNGGFDYNPTANTLEILTTNGGTHSEFNANAFVPSSNGGKNLGANALRWGTVHAQVVKIDGDTAWHAGNDGAGSGLDADTVDGQQGSYYLDYNNFTNVPSGGTATNADTVDNLHAASFLRSDADDTATGRIVLGSAITSSSAKLQVNGFIRTCNIYMHQGGAGPASETVGKSLGNVSGALQWDGNTIWHAGNDGTGSGLDADTIDGVQGYKLFSSYNNGQGGWEDSNANFLVRSGSTSVGLCMENSSGTFGFQLYASGSTYGFLTSNWGSWDIKKTVNGQMALRVSGTDYNVWHTGNDGAGSGLDADSLDGYTWDTAGKDLRGTNIRATEWLRNTDSGDGMYNEATGAHFYSDADQTWNITGNTQNEAVNLKFRGTYAGNIEGWIYADGTGRLGQLTNTGNWFTWSYINQGNSPNLWFSETAGETWTGNPGSDQGKIEYHANRFYIASGSNSTSICVFRRSGSSVATVENDGRIFAEGSNEVWHSGNDGSGSGLDADTLDGISSLSFLRSDSNDETGSAVKTLFRGAINSGSAATVQINGFFRAGPLYLHEFNGTSVTETTGKELAAVSGDLKWNGNYVWTSGNDGSGSGLDADTLDGAHASSFLQTDSNGNLLLADGKNIYMSGYVNDNTFNVASLFVDAIKCGVLRIHDGRHTTGGSSLMHNTIIGNSARTYSYADGDHNTVVGSFAGYEMTSGTRNTLIGTGAQQKITTGRYGTYVGSDAGKWKRYGDNCTGIGYKCDWYTTTGSTNNTENYSNTTCLGYDSRTSGSNQVVAGNTSAVLHYYSLSNRSDERDKIDIQDEFLGLDFIKKLKPRAYKWDYRDDYFDEVFDEVEYSDNPGEFDKVARLVPVPKDGSRSGTRLHHGLIAQEVKELIDETGVDFAGYQDSKVKNGEDVLSMNYLELIAPMIKAIQEQQVQIDSLTETIESMK